MQFLTDLKKKTKGMQLKIFKPWLVWLSGLSAGL